MPSLESYRRRKQEIEHLTRDLIDALERNRNALRHIEDLECYLKYANIRRKQAETMMSVWQQYVVDHYLTDLPKPILIRKDGAFELAEQPITDIPVCIKPKDVSSYIFRNEPGEGDNGPDNLP